MAQGGATGQGLGGGGWDEAWCATVHGLKELGVTERMNNNIRDLEFECRSVYF